ncbi:MAG: molybdate ABC transporter substrate-binding protein [Heliomarina sp.]|uniref:molybdate ABC transporter substrate-binding protein n=1 Tax=Heliomarina sp. TaxID=2917556 RepID=UPI004058A81E
MRHVPRNLLSAFLLAVLVLTPWAGRAADLTVFAAASLKTAMDQISDRFEEASGLEIAVALAGSSALARQIEQGAPADVFISANSDWMDHLERNGFIRSGSRFDLLGNRLALIAYGTFSEPVVIDSALDLTDMLKGGRLAMALVDAVPAGIYGKQALASLGLWEEVAPQVAQADNVRAALALVATGAAPLGLVYASDAMAEKRVKVLGIFPKESHDPIIYPVAITSRGDAEPAQRFLDFLREPENRLIFEEQGFEVLAE